MAILKFWPQTSVDPFSYPADLIYCVTVDWLWGERDHQVRPFSRLYVPLAQFPQYRSYAVITPGQVKNMA
jgi:hypothetical protein